MPGRKPRTSSSRRRGLRGRGSAAVGAQPIRRMSWGTAAESRMCPSPAGYGSLGSLADHGIAEFLLTLRHP